MSKYLPVIEFTTTFQDDTVKVTLEPIDRATFIKVLPTFQAAQGASSEDRFNRVYGTACDVLTSNLKTIAGLRDANGNAVEINTVLSKIYFSKLVSEIFMHLMASATVEGKVQSLSEAS